jgi:hypothetical protein
LEGSLIWKGRLIFWLWLAEWELDMSFLCTFYDNDNYTRLQIAASILKRIL